MLQPRMVRIITNMFGLSKLTVWVFTGLVAVLTIFFNSYIFLVSLWRQKDKKQRSPSDVIIIALSVSNTIYQLVSYIWMTMDIIDVRCRIDQMFYTILLLVIMSLKFTILWDTSFLAFYYSTKLVSTPNHCYTQINTAILKHVTLVVCLIALMGLATCIPVLFVFHPNNQTAVNKDCGILMPDSTAGEIYNITFLLLSDVLPGLIMLKCCVSISFHLGMHLHRMKASTNGAHPPKLDSQMRVIQMALTLVINFLIFLMADLYVNYQIVVNNDSLVGVAILDMSTFAAVTAAVLIYGKKTLWKALIHEINSCLDEYPCLFFLKLREKKAAASKTPEKDM
uniref:Taste receptor type 2 n=1 Tax=Oryzias sinensis TaxID=183150 RepID=A0A8C8DIZ6_9TELE